MTMSHFLYLTKKSFAALLALCVVCKACTVADVSPSSSMTTTSHFSIPHEEIFRGLAFALRYPNWKQSFGSPPAFCIAHEACTTAAIIVYDINLHKIWRCCLTAWRTMESLSRFHMQCLTLWTVQC
ncbi:hypothetical protein MSAN_02073800 [Mycena sanguinolenta]|uniref:Secreted protein n=1 Tax=Mycena sanguinolenta TaxID=230812 RepID=A0A8H6XK14_9AGAR|nr:hypothetical protein MSAN_02073800 [Mycena sanguinolenta]